jgi:hypothetical protein
VIVNRDLNQAFAELRAMLAAERLWRERQDRPVGFRAGGAVNLDGLSKSGSFCQNCDRTRLR